MSVNKTSKLKITVIHGPNLNLLGKRETKIYGHVTLDEINKKLHEIALSENIEISFFQSNHEGAIIDCIQDSLESHGFLINPAAFTHTSIAIRDALLAVNKPFVEVHLSDINNREDFRKISYFSDVAISVVSGLGENSYYKGLKTLIDHIKNEA